MDVFGTVMQACGVGIVAALCLTVVGKLSGAYGSALRIGGAVLLFGIFLWVFVESVDTLRSVAAAVSENGFAAEAFEVMLKALGVALLCRFCSDVCRDCGEQTLATGVESVGRIVIFSLALPMLAEVLGVAGEMLGMS